MEVRLYIKKDANGSHRMFVRRGKFKHLFELGKHQPTDNAFYSALREGNLDIFKTVKQSNTLFE